MTRREIDDAVLNVFEDFVEGFDRKDPNVAIASYGIDSLDLIHVVSDLEVVFKDQALYLDDEDVSRFLNMSVGEFCDFIFIKVSR